MIVTNQTVAQAKAQILAESKQKPIDANHNVVFTHGDVVGRLIHQNEHEYYIHFTNVKEGKIWVTAYPKTKAINQVYKANEEDRFNHRRFNDFHRVGRLDKHTINNMMREGSWGDQSHLRKVLNTNRHLRTYKGRI